MLKNVEHGVKPLRYLFYLNSTGGVSVYKLNTLSLGCPLLPFQRKPGMSLRCKIFHIFCDFSQIIDSMLFNKVTNIFSVSNNQVIHIK